MSKSLNKKVVHIAFIKHVTELTKMICCPHCKNFWLNAKNDKSMNYARKMKTHTASCGQNKEAEKKKQVVLGVNKPFVQKFNE